MEEIKAEKLFKPLQRKVKDVSLIKVIREQGKNASAGYISHYVFQTGTGALCTHFNDVCYARFKAAKIIKARLFINQYTRHFEGKEAFALYKKYVDWIVKRSPWKYAFLNANGDYLKDGLAINCNVNSTYAVGAMTAVREAIEYPHQVGIFDTLTKQGISPHLAQMVAGQMKDEKSLGGRGSGHCLFLDNIGRKTLKAYKEGKHSKQDARPLKKDASSYYGIQNLFSNDPVTLQTELKPFTKLVKDGGWYQVRTIDLTSPEVIQKLKEIDNA